MNGEQFNILQKRFIFNIICAVANQRKKSVSVRRDLSGISKFRFNILISFQIINEGTCISISKIANSTSDALFAFVIENDDQKQDKQNIQDQ